MKTKIIGAILGLFGLFLLTAYPQAGTISASCTDGVLGSGNCYPGHVAFTVSGLGAVSLVHVKVTRADGAVYDDYDYTVTGGHTSFTQTLYPASGYTVQVGGASLTLTTGN